MSDPETLDTRRRKRIVEFVLSGFDSGDHAISFGKMINRGIKSRLWCDELRIDASIANPQGVIAITKDWVGPTVLKLTILDIPGQNTAIFIRDYIRQSVRSNELGIEKEVVREKPQPQTITLEQIPSSFKLFNVG